MKRLITFGIILAGLAVFCPGQYRPRRVPRKIFKLTEPNLTGSVSLEEVLAKRRSVRRFTAEVLKSSEIGQLAWAGQGITDPRTGFRTAPSAGATYPIRLYFATEKGLFLYDPLEHGLEQLSDLDVRVPLAVAAMEQSAVAEAACDIIIAGSTRELAPKYGKSAKNFMLLEAGHIAQNIQLQAVSLGLGSVPIG
ncbi:MAG: SagB/ThcOx family dehydrogenase, partial [Planctomycetota bacterium]